MLNGAKTQRAETGSGDMLDGGPGGDTLHGGPGGDTLMGGPTERQGETNMLKGNTGDDTYVVVVGEATTVEEDCG